MTIKYIVFVLLMSGLFTDVVAQKVVADSNSSIQGEVVTPVEEPGVKPHSPKKATLLSVFIPGAGQIYNNKWWKAPIAWVGIGGAIYIGEVNRKEYLFWKDQYIKRVDPNQEDSYPNSSDEFLIYQRNEYRRLTETSYVVAGVIYIIQIIDATVDAHLMTFDVSDDLSMRISPEVLEIRNYANKPTFGLSIKLGFK